MFIIQVLVMMIRIRIDRRLIIFPARFWPIHYKHAWLNLKSERPQQGKQIAKSVKVTIICYSFRIYLFPTVKRNTQ